MEISESSLRKTYEAMETEELYELHRHGHLTDIAFDVLNAVLRERSIPKVASDTPSESPENGNSICPNISEPRHNLSTPRVSKSKPSMWWIVHIWAGLCLKIYLDITGLSKLLLGPPTRSVMHTDAQAAVAGLIAIGSFIAGMLLSKKLVDRIETSTLPNAGKLTIKLTLPFIYGFGLVQLSKATMLLLA